MSIFGIIGISFASAAVVAMFLMLIMSVGFDCDDVLTYVTMMIVIVAVLITGTFVGIGLVTDDARIYVTKFETQKVTIEQSLSSDTLTGFERIELVNKAIELNGELAERKAYANLWHVVLYDESIYDNVEFIQFN